VKFGTGESSPPLPLHTVDIYNKQKKLIYVY